MPAGFLSFYGKISRLDKKLKLPPKTAVLIRERVASINSCLWCMDVARWYVMTKSPENLERVDALPDYRTSPLFSDAERAALDYATELTTSKKVDPDTFAGLASHYDEREIRAGRTRPPARSGCSATSAPAGKEWTEGVLAGSPRDCRLAVAVRANQAN